LELYYWKDDLRDFINKELEMNMDYEKYEILKTKFYMTSKKSVTHRNYFSISMAMEKFEEGTFEIFDLVLPIEKRSKKFLTKLIEYLKIDFCLKYNLKKIVISCIIDKKIFNFLKRQGFKETSQSTALVSYQLELMPVDVKESDCLMDLEFIIE
jgi:hypothetical protein